MRETATYEQTGPGWITLCNNVCGAVAGQGAARLFPPLPAPAGAGTVILMIYTWLRNTLSKTRNSMRAGRWPVSPARRDRPGRKRWGAGGVQAGLYRLARRYGNLPPQGCICVRRYPVCRERCGQPVQRRGVRPCRRRQEALGSIKEWKHGEATRKFGRPNGITRANDKIYVTHEEAVPRFLMRRAIGSLPA